MYHPTTRLLTILNLLESHEEMTGKELARRLEVEPRTIRRYITMLQELGIPVEAERGRAGAYFLRPGYTMPPLMLSSEEAFAVALSLRLAQETALFGAGILLEGASAKIERVLPEALRRDVQAVIASLSMETNLVPTIATSARVIQTLTNACYQHQSVTLQHQAFDGELTERVIDPYGVVYRLGRWYVVGYCHLREELRTFRLDRIITVQVLDTCFEPQAINLIEHVERALSKTPGIFHVKVIFQASLKTLRTYIPSALGELAEINDGQTQLSCFVQNLGWIAGFLAGIPLSFRVIQPTALQQELRAIFERLKANSTFLSD
jgi:predicted DNA-binding transcriptional regulator YafY